MTNVDISVVIPTYNRVHTIERAIQSVLSQTVPPREVIIIDDGSSDGTLLLITSKFPAVTVLANDGNYGVSFSRNRGIHSARSRWLAFLDSDDEWQPNKLLEQQNCLAEDRQAVFCHTDEIWIRNGVRVNAHNKHKKQGGDIFDRCLAMCAVSPSSVVMHRSLFDRFGFFDENLPACEDYDLWLRIAAHIHVSYIDQQLVLKYGGHDDQLSRKHWGMDRFRVTSMNNLLVSGNLSAEQKIKTRTMLGMKLRILRDGAIKRGKGDETAIWAKLIEENNRHLGQGV